MKTTKKKSGETFTFGEIKDKNAISALIYSLADQDCDVRKEAIVSLAKIGEPAAVAVVDWLLEGFYDPPTLSAPDKRPSTEVLIETVKMMGAPALEYLSELLISRNHIPVWCDDDDYNRKREADCCKRIGKDIIGPLLFCAAQEWRLYGEAFDIAENIIANMGELAVKPLCKAAKGNSWEARRLATRILGKIGTQQAVDFLIEESKNKDFSVRHFAVIALGKTGNRRAVTQLAAAVDDENRLIRSCAIDALVEIKNNLAVECLISALRSSHLGVRRKAAIGLWKITRQDFGQDVKKWQEWYSRKNETQERKE